MTLIGSAVFAGRAHERE